MKLRSLLFGLCAACSLSASAQVWTTDSVTMGPGYGNDILYSLHNGVQRLETSGDWTIAFQTTVFGEPSFNAAVRVNHYRGVSIYPLHLTASTSFDNITAADTIGKTAYTMQLLNNDTSWGTGALYQNKVIGDPYDFGWGEYAGAPSHAVVGKDSVYLIKTTGGSAYKLWMKKYYSYPNPDSVGYTFRIATLGGGSDQTITFFRKPNFTDRLFAYYKAGDSAVTDREVSRSAWDMLFTTYSKIIPNGQGGTMLQGYSGVLSNEGLQVADVRNVNPDTAHYQNYARTHFTNEIGDDWKHFNMTSFMYELDTTATFFIKAVSSNEYYQLQFTRFDGSTTGKVVFRKRAVGTTAVTGIAAQSLAAWTIAPNPAGDRVSVMIDAKEAAGDAKLLVIDGAGKMVEQLPTPLQKGMNAYGFSAANLPAGLYFIHLGAGSWSVTQRLVVAH